MPLPFILAPAIVATAKAASVSVGYYIGGGVIGGAGLAGGIWYYTASNERRLLQEHIDSLNAQHNITNLRIETANTTLGLLCKNVILLQEEINATTGSTTISVERLKEITKQLSDTSQILQTAIGCVDVSTANLDRSFVGLKEVSEQFQSIEHQSKARMAALDEHLAQKEIELTQAASDISLLSQSVGEQTQVIEQLSAIVSKLTDKNRTQDQSIDQKDKQIDQLKTKCTRLLEQCRFFRQVLKQQTTPSTVVMHNIPSPTTR